VLSHIFITLTLCSCHTSSDVSSTKNILRWCCALLGFRKVITEKLTDAQVIKKFRLYWNHNVHCHIHRSVPLEPFLSQMNAFHIPICYSFKIQSAIILLSILRSSHLLVFGSNFSILSRVWVTIDGVWIGNWIY
jgi:hypothetical protein